VLELFENRIARLWNSARRDNKPATGGVLLGSVVHDGIVASEHAFLAHSKRAEHIAITGRTGSGKTNLIEDCQSQDVRERRGFLPFDFHDEITAFALKTIAAEERRTGQDLSQKTILIDPTDPTYSVGLNILEKQSDKERFVQVAEFAAILKRRWGLDSFGARTEELLRNSLHAVAENELTLLELPPFLTSTAFRAKCLKSVANSEVREYFQTRYNATSASMQAAMSGPVLNKLTAFTGDPHFRHMFGQQRSTLSLSEAMDKSCWVLLRLPKGKLGPEAATTGALFLQQLINLVFARRNRRLFTIYADEIKNLIVGESGLEVLLAEARKFNIGVVSANQYLDQFPSQLRSALDAIGTHIYFQLSAPDATQVASSLDGGKSLAELLKNLPRGEFVLKTGSQPWIRVRAPQASAPDVDYSDLKRRCLARLARNRTDIEREIQGRQAVAHGRRMEALDGWE